ncbi:MAG: magnesium protoporphyrin IX methyltransferase [Pseudomonadota bacterium]
MRVLTTTFEQRKDELKTYFGETAADKWVALTSNSPVSRIRETVRAGRAETASTLLDWLGDDLTGLRILDAGCGTGRLAEEMGQRGAHVTAIDISTALIEEAQERMPSGLAGSITYHAGDMTDPALGAFDHVVAMDSFIHYPLPAIIDLLEGFAPRTNGRILFTFAPSTRALRAMKAVGKLFPRNDRSPAIEPVAKAKLLDAIGASECVSLRLAPGRSHLVSTGFYKSNALELRPFGAVGA